MQMENVEDIYALSPIQQGMLFHSLYEPQAGAYFEQWHCLLGALDPDAFRRAWERVIRHHPILRTAFFWEGLDQPVQVVRQAVEPAWTEQDWRGLDPAARPQRLAAFLAADRERGFILERAPLLRFALLRLGERDYRFVWSCHHLLVDGWCQSLLFREVLACYRALRRGQDCPLPPARPYRDYIAWLQERDPARAEAFWRRELAGIDAPTPLILPHPDPDPGPEPFGERERDLAAAEWSDLEGLARRLRLTPATLVLGAWALLLGRYSGEPEVLFGTTVAGRPPQLPGVEGIVGPFINTLPVRVGTRSAAPLGDWLRDLQQRQAARDEYAHCALTDIQGWSAVPRGRPLFETLVVFENVHRDTPDSAGDDGPTVSGPAGFGRTHYPLTLVAGPRPGGGLGLKLLHDRGRCDGAGADRLLEQFRTLLLTMAERPERPVAELPWLEAAERRRVLMDWNATAAPLPQCSLAALFAEQAAERPAAPALVWEGGSLSYGELAERAERLAGGLRARGGGAGGPGRGVPGALPGAGRGRAGHSARGGRLPAPGPGLPPRAAGLHAGRRRPPAGALPGGAGRAAACPCRAGGGGRAGWAPGPPAGGGAGASGLCLLHLRLHRPAQGGGGDPAGGGAAGQERRLRPPGRRADLAAALAGGLRRLDPGAVGAAAQRRPARPAAPRRPGPGGHRRGHRQPPGHRPVADGGAVPSDGRRAPGRVGPPAPAPGRGRGPVPGPCAQTAGRPSPPDPDQRLRADREHHVLLLPAPDPGELSCPHRAHRPADCQQPRLCARRAPGAAAGGGGRGAVRGR